MGCLIGALLAAFLGFVTLALWGFSITGRAKRRARKIVAHGRIADEVEFARVARILAKAYKDREAADLLSHLTKLKNAQVERTRSQYPTASTARTDSMVTPAPTPIQQERFVEVRPIIGKSQPAGGISISVRFDTPRTSFLAEAERYHGREGHATEPVPFMRYWPTYAAMNEQQQSWYFYWRSQVRQDNYLPTDLSYIFLHVYETISLIENPDPGVAADHIWQLWQKYRAQHPKLDYYLPEWGGDLLALKKGAHDGIQWWQRAAPMMDRAPTQIMNVIIQQFVDNARTAEIPYAIWAMLMDYHPRNKFYKEHNADGHLDRAYEKAIHVADEYWQESKSQGLLAEFTSPVLYDLHKAVFPSALVGYSHPEQLQWGKSRNYVGEARLSSHLTSVAKYAENLLRKQARFPSRLSGITLDEGLSQALDAAFLPEAPPPETVKITIDQARVAALHQESETIGAMLESPSAEEAASPAKPLYTDLAEMRQLWSLLDIPERTTLAGMYGRQITTLEALARHLSEQATLPGALIDHVNKRSLELLGDRLIYLEEQDVLSLAEDYIDELEVVIAESPPESRPSGTVPITTDDPWDHLFARLAPAEITLIRLFAENGEVAELDIETVTRVHNVMANAALDSLNEKGADALGHPPFYLEGERWTVEEDDLVALRQHLLGKEPGANVHTET